MSSTVTKLSQIVVNLLPVPNIAVFEQLEYTDDSGKVAAQMLPGRDLTAADAQAAAFDSVIALQQATIASLNAQVAELQKQLAAASIAPVATTDSDALLAKLNTVFATIPDEYKAQFAAEYATVRVLVQAGQTDLAAAVVQGVTVPDALSDLKTQILAALQS